MAHTWPPRCHPLRTPHGNPQNASSAIDGVENAAPQWVHHDHHAEPALRYMDVDAEAAGLISHRERYEHFGDVDCFVGDPTMLIGVPV